MFTEEKNIRRGHLKFWNFSLFHNYENTFIPFSKMPVIVRLIPFYWTLRSLETHLSADFFTWNSVKLFIGWSQSGEGRLRSEVRWNKTRFAATPLNESVLNNRPWHMCRSRAKCGTNLLVNKSFGYINNSSSGGSLNFVIKIITMCRTKGVKFLKTLVYLQIKEKQLYHILINFLSSSNWFLL